MQVPLIVRRFLRRGLEKDPKKRLRGIGDAMEMVAVDAEPAPAAATTPSQSKLGWIMSGVAALAIVCGATANSRSAYRAVDYDYPLAIARHARDHGATHFALTSSLGADPRSPFVYTRTKGELELELKKLGFPVPNDRSPKRA